MNAAISLAYRAITELEQTVSVAQLSLLIYSSTHDVISMKFRDVHCYHIHIWNSINPGKMCVYIYPCCKHFP